MKILLSIKEASEICGLDDKKISDAIKNGEIKVFLLPGMKIPKIPIKELEKWIDRNTIQSSPIKYTPQTLQRI